MAFIPNPDNLPQVNHKDEDKQNNNVLNLEWCSNLYNMRYGTGRKRAAEHCCKPVNQYNLDGTFVRRWKSAADAGKHGYTKNAITVCCQNNRRTHKGYIWRYAE